MVMMTSSSSLKELLCKLERYAPHRVSVSPMGSLWDLRLNTCGAYVTDSANSVDTGLLIAASFLEAQQRGWQMGLSNITEDLKVGYFCRIEFSNDSEVTEESDNPAIACLGALVKAFEERQAQEQDFAEWG